MNTDIKKYPIFILVKGRLIQTDKIKSTKDYNHLFYELHHFIPQTLRKNKPEEYKKIEHLQKLILLEKDIHRSLPNYTPERCKTVTGINKEELLYRR